MVNAAKLKELLAQKDETPTTELKLRYVLSGQGKGKILDEVAKDIIALTNTAGRKIDDYAYLVIGAGDKIDSDGTRKREDVRSYDFGAALFLSITNTRCNPSIPDIQYHQLEVDGNYYGVVTIPPSPHMHALTRDLDTPKGGWRKGSVLIRHGDGVAVASYEEMVVMKLEKGRLNATEGVTTEISDSLSRVQSKSVGVERHDLEIAAGWQEMIKSGHSVEGLANKAKKSKTVIRGFLRLKELSGVSLKALRDGKFSKSLCDLVVTIPNEERRDKFAKEVLTGGQHGEPMSFRKAKEWKELHYMKDLRGAPFPLDDPTLDPEWGKTCTKGSCQFWNGNTSEQRQGKRANICLNPDHYAKLVQLSAARTTQCPNTM